MADSLDSGSSVLYGRAGSSPASRTKKKDRLLPVFLFGLWGCEESAFYRGPRANPAQRFAWGKEPQRSDRAFAARRKRGMHSLRRRRPASRTKKKDRLLPVFLFGLWGCEESAFYRGPRANPAQRFAWGKEPQRSDRAFAARRKRGMHSLRRRRPASLQRIRGTPGRHLTLASSLAIIKSDNGCRRQSI